jgi:2,3-bisphosphoglycerate-dependent phosphoglycerate mutase
MSRRFAALVRHGEYHQLPKTPSAHQPFALTSEGEGHALRAVQMLTDALHENGWVLHPCIDTSRMLRAWQTARIISDGLAETAQSEIELESFNALAERGVGSAANLSIETIEEVLRQDPRFSALPVDWKSNSHYQLPFQGAESLMQAGERVAEHLEYRMTGLLDESGSGTDLLKVFVGHGAAFRHAAYHLGVLEFDDIAKLSMYHGAPVILEYVSKQSWRHFSGEWKVRTSETTEID